MTDLGLVYLQLLVISPRFQRRNAISFLLCIHALSVLPTVVAGDRSAFIVVEGKPSENNPGSVPVPPEAVPGLGRSEAYTIEDGGLFRDIHGESRLAHGETKRLRLRGSFVRAGTIKSVEGVLKKIPLDDCHQGNEHDDDTDSIKSTAMDHDWVAVLEVPAGRAKAEHHTSECQSVLDKVRKAMLLGASAIIILAMNPKVVTELDIAQLFPRPIVLIKEVENVTALLSALASKISMKVRMTYNLSSYDLQNISTLTLWTTCGRSSAVRSYGTFDGVICLGSQGEDVSKEDPGEFWSYFFSGLSILILLFMLKARHSPEEINTVTQTQTSLERLSRYAINKMKVRRYRHGDSRNHDDSDRDTCAVCLDAFNKKQKIRVLPCFHEFHVACVDPWLLSHQTCPLCKLNIIAPCGLTMDKCAHFNHSLLQSHITFGLQTHLGETYLCSYKPHLLLLE